MVTDVYLLGFYILVTSEVTCRHVMMHTQWDFTSGILGGGGLHAISTMIRYPTQPYYSGTEPTSHLPALVLWRWRRLEVRTMDTDSTHGVSCHSWITITLQPLHCLGSLIQSPYLHLSLYVMPTWEISTDITTLVTPGDVVVSLPQVDCLMEHR